MEPTSHRDFKTRTEKPRAKKTTVKTNGHEWLLLNWCNNNNQMTILLSDRPTVQWWFRCNLSILPASAKSRLTGLWQEALRDKDKGTKDKKWLSWLKGPQSEPTSVGKCQRGSYEFWHSNFKHGQQGTKKWHWTISSREPWNNREKTAPQGTTKVI